MSNFMENLRQLLLVVYEAGMIAALIEIIRRALLSACNLEWLLGDGEDKDDE